MSDNSRDELDVLLERALRKWAADEAPPERVWTNIRLGLHDRSRQSPARSGRVRLWWTEAWALGADIVVSARMILTPSLQGGENGWTRRLVVAGPSSSSLRLSIHH